MLRLTEVRLRSDLKEKLGRLAGEQGRESEALVIEAVERLVNYDDCFIREVEKGLAAADHGEFADHGEREEFLARARIGYRETSLFGDLSRAVPRG